MIINVKYPIDIFSNRGKPTMPISKNKTSSLSQDKGDETSRLNIILSKSFHKEIKQRALDEDITVTELIIKAVKDYLAK